VAHVVGFELRLGLRLADHLADPLHVCEGVAEDVVAGALEVVYLPLLVVPAALGDGEEAEVEAASIEGCHLGAELGEDGGPLFERHAFAAACGGLHDHVAPLLDARDHLAEELEG
jgi:hypothetical protein